MKTQPRFRELGRREIDEILGRNHVGRIAYTGPKRVEMVPVHYISQGGWIYGRTTPGTLLERTAAKRPLHVAFEVDEVDELFEWRSVIVHGELSIASEDEMGLDREGWMKGVGMLRRLIPDSFRSDDPVPFRTAIFRIAVQEAAGREAYVRADDAGRPG